MMKKTALILAILAFLLLNLTIAYVAYINNNNIQNYFRVHITANSDSIDDQLLKYTISKEVNSYIEQITKNTKTKEEAKEIIEENIYKILNICKNIVTNNNYNYDVKAYMGQIEYDEKIYNDLKMDKGIYDSLKITIGKGEGQNWWSLIYPTYTEEELLDPSTEYSLFIVDFIKGLFVYLKPQNTLSNNS